MSQTDHSDATKAPKNQVAHLERQRGSQSDSQSDAPDDGQNEAWKDARKAAQAEKDMTLWQALQSNWRAALWSAVISLTIIMEGYDVGLIYQFFAYPSFGKTFGHWDESSESWQLSSAWQAGLSNGAGIGIIIGGFVNGFLSAKFGYKKVVLGSLFVMNFLIFIPFFATNKPTLLVGQILCGLTWGVFATTGPAYASEVCPQVLRGYLTCYVNLCWAIGQLIAAGVLYGALHLPGRWPYRLCYALQWVWPIPLFLIIMFAPESPWFLVRNNRVEDAHKSLEKLGTKDTKAQQQTLAQIVHTLKLEGEMHTGTSYLDLFKGVDRRRTEIACGAFMGQVLSGSVFAFGPTYFFQQAGIETDQSYKIAVGGAACGFVGTVFSWFLISKFGRRTLYLSGLILCSLMLLIIGILASTSEETGSKFGQAALCILWLLIYSATLGPICYTIISETSSLGLRAKSVCFSRNVYNIAQIVANVIEPRLINPLELNMKGKTAYVWFVTACIAILWTYFRLPECRGRTYEELDVMFHEKVPARKFASWKGNAYDNDLSRSTELSRNTEE